MSIHPQKLTWKPKWRFGRNLSFSERGWFSGSMLVFREYTSIFPVSLSLSLDCFDFILTQCGNVSKILSAQTWWLSFANFQTTHHRRSCFGKQSLLRYTHRECWTCFFAVPQTYTETTSSPKERQGNIPRCTCHLWWVPYHASKQLSKVRQINLLGTAVYIWVISKLSKAKQTNLLGTAVYIRGDV